MKSSDNDPYYRYFAGLRIFGKKVDFDEITNKLGIEPTHIYRRQVRATKKFLHLNDMWMLEANIPRESGLEKHLLWLKKKLLPHKNYILELKKKYAVDIYCIYGSDNDQGGFEISPKCIELFSEFGISLGLSILKVRIRDGVNLLTLKIKKEIENLNGFRAKTRT